MSEKEKIIALLDDVPEYKIGYILAYVQGITAEEKDTKESESAYQQLLQMKRKAPDDFDYDNELENARMEKYESIG